ncbi:hypothetical protein MVEN_01851900 [Mycena venus]|uniref:Uncharacterized protein n=1 Tax=Mycena venus TaxID=2733690 RepID=A0A8H7CKQ3_9AGAR|nr:hypothetical protein MVEN_01851900 [Mycena venus]
MVVFVSHSSQTVSQVSVSTEISLQAQAKSPFLPLPSQGFPTAWLVSCDNQVFTNAQWNHEAPPADAPEGDEFTVDWSTSNSAPYFSLTANGLAVGPTIIRFYFGLPGCVIPIASVPMFGETPAMVFTIAGPAKEGTKPFYVYLHNPQKLSASELYCLRSFSSVADFFRNSHVEPWGQMCLSPVHGGEDATTKELIKCGYLYDELPKNYTGSIE